MIIFRRALWRGPAFLVLALLASTLAPTIAIASPTEAAAGASMREAAAPENHQYTVRRAFESVSRIYGSATDTAKRIVISPETTQVVLDPDIGLRGPEVYCQSVLDATSPLAGLFAESNEWTANPTPTVAVTPGAVVGGSGAVFSYMCNSGEEESDRVTWYFVEGPGAGETVTLGHDTALLVQRERTLNWGEGPDAGPPIAAAFGDGFTVAGAAGLWPTAPDSDTSVVMYPSGGGADPVTIEDASINVDGSALTFSLPTGIDPRYLNTDAEIVVSAFTSEPGEAGSIQINRTLWAAAIYFPGPEKVASTTTAKLDRTYTLSRLRPKLTIAITAEALPLDVGYVTVNIDGVDQITKVVPAAEITEITIALPTLSRGVHHITARYAGSTNVHESISGQLRLRVLV